MTRWKERIKEKAKDSESHLVFMGVASFLESMVLPIPLETILIPYYHTHRDTIWRTALVVTLACLMGAGVFYAIGSLAMDSWGQTVITTLSSEQSFEDLKNALNGHGFLLILLAGITPIPFQIAMLAAGAVDFSFGMFMLAAALARGLRYFGLAFLVIKYGDAAAVVWREDKLKASAIGVGAIALIYGLGRLLENQVIG